MYTILYIIWSAVVQGVIYEVPNYLTVDQVYIPANCTGGSSHVSVGDVVRLGYVGTRYKAGKAHVQAQAPTRRYTPIVKEIRIGSLQAAFPGMNLAALKTSSTNGLLEEGLLGACVGEIRNIILPPSLVFDPRQVERLAAGYILAWEVEIYAINNLMW
eukprot:TRINITY_DN19588_c0_g1_i1.p1 TRINITY_DN19588_c0_g1~~TRINITY_DN19588_c0_g1_i1.p1  ORF type:complete len:158 (+),score=13.84 TRINITY_DN19588_c0_g1_i1:97-570(+)